MDFSDLWIMGLKKDCVRSDGGRTLVAYSTIILELSKQGRGNGWGTGGAVSLHFFNA